VYSIVHHGPLILEAVKVYADQSAVLHDGRRVTTRELARETYRRQHLLELIPCRLIVWAWVHPDLLAQALG
jgi:hypothetical protein